MCTYSHVYCVLKHVYMCTCVHVYTVLVFTETDKHVYKKHMCNV